MPVLSRLRSSEELVGELSCLVQLPVIGMQVALGRLDRGVPEDALQHMERHPGISEPGRAGVTEAMPGEVRQSEVDHDLIPVRRVSDGRGREHAAPRPAQERIFGLLARRETHEHWFELIEDRHEPGLAALGLLANETSLARSRSAARS